MAIEGDRPLSSAVLIIKRNKAPDGLLLVQPPARTRFVTALSLALAATLLCGWANLASGRRTQQAASGDLAHSKGWKLVGGQRGVEGQEQFVLVEAASESNRKLYDDVIARLCRKGEWCGLQFWSDSSLIPNHLPLSDDQAASEVANYTQNPDSGFAQFVWNCRVRNDPLNCFSYR
jgi:hypothetical protein